MLSMRSLSASRCAFSTTSRVPKEFIVIAYDADTSDALQHRLDVRPRHLKQAHKVLNNGFLKYAGAILKSHEPVQVQGAKAPAMIGSVMVVEAESEQEVKQRLDEDPYVKEGVWKQWEIRPFKRWLPDA
ncbi:hypothetical protein BZG36_02254 [Bifiguratus adelaidae]|uniref:YCII-related domain-containing protein n=1 Tax=Bifiguratus adelaidae TaxID=1938954 RepID=A0A261Y1Q5_9FUNG|nr:hypothetical protein BZG36_02254 [Bifiguratus adelaidae]